VAEACLQNVTGSLELELTADQRSKLKREFEGMVKRIWDVTVTTALSGSPSHTTDGRFRRRIERTVASLPSQTLAEVAEDLVRLTITRQKVWPDGVETVGGDVDVAVMSKYESFVWSSRRDQA